MRTIPAGEFKVRCLRVMDEVRKSRTPVVITKNGRPLAKLVPPWEEVAETNVTPAGRVSVTTAPTEPFGPWLVTVRV